MYQCTCKNADGGTHTHDNIPYFNNSSKCEAIHWLHPDAAKCQHMISVLSVPVVHRNRMDNTLLNSLTWSVPHVVSNLTSVVTCIVRPRGVSVPPFTAVRRKEVCVIAPVRSRARLSQHLLGQQWVAASIPISIINAFAIELPDWLIDCDHLRCIRGVSCIRG